jgi:hypothetical protein
LLFGNFISWSSAISNNNTRYKIEVKIHVLRNFTIMDMSVGGSLIKTITTPNYFVQIIVIEEQLLIVKHNYFLFHLIFNMKKFHVVETFYHQRINFTKKTILARSSTSSFLFYCYYYYILMVIFNSLYAPFYNWET